MIEIELFCENNKGLETVNCFGKKLHHVCLEGL